MLISFIAAMSKNQVIGQGNQLPWHLPADLKHFKAVTLGKPVIMGRKTYESIGKPLPQRTNIILTTDLDYQATGCYIAHNREEALNLSKAADEVLIIGGASIYQSYLALVQRIYLTLVDTMIDGDTFFPVLDQKDWQVVSREDYSPDENNHYSYSFLLLEREMGS